MNENGGKNNTILLTVIAIATLLVVVTGATFAYFAAIVNGNDKASSIQITASSTGTEVIFQGGETVELTNIYPRTEAWKTKTLTLKTVPSSNATGTSKYVFKIVEDTNGFDTRNTAAGQEAYNDSENLKFSFIYDSTNSKNVQTHSNTDKTSITSMSNKEIATGTINNADAATIIYTLTVYYDNDDTINQNTGLDRTYTFHIEYELTNVTA